MHQAASDILYDQDFCQWVEDTVTKLKARKVEDLDWKNLIEEMESLAKRDKRELENRLDLLLNQLLRRCYLPTPEHYRTWELLIREQRKQLQRLLKQSPCLETYLLLVLDEVWQVALVEAQQDYPDIDFPIAYPFDRSIALLLNKPLW